MNQRIATVISSYRSEFPNPLQLLKGEIIHAHKKPTQWDGWYYCQTQKGNTGWVPEVFIDQIETTIELFKVNRDYDATELTANPGDKFLIIEIVARWAYLENLHGDRGWLPLENLTF